MENGPQLQRTHVFSLCKSINHLLLFFAVILTGISLQCWVIAKLAMMDFWKGHSEVKWLMINCNILICIYDLLDAFVSKQSYFCCVVSDGSWIISFAQSVSLKAFISESELSHNTTSVSFSVRETIRVFFFYSQLHIIWHLMYHRGG